MSMIPPREFVRVARDYCRAHELLPRRSRVVVGVSGGADSMALLTFLHEVSGPLALRLTVAHLDHALRRESRADARFVASAAAGLGWPCVLAREKVSVLARRHGCSVEEAGRLARYHFFYRLARLTRAGIVAVGHHRDDQSETVLMRLLRGASGSGLSGIAPHRLLKDPLGERPGPGRGVFLVRPLLGIGRGDIESFLTARHIAFRNDRTNLDRAFARNRIRRELIPMLERRYNPGLRGVLARAAQALSEDDVELENQAEVVVRRSARCSRGRVTFTVRGLVKAPLPVRRRALRIAVALAGGAMNRLTQAHLDALVRLAGSSSGETHLPGARAFRSAGNLVVKKLRSR